MDASTDTERRPRPRRFIGAGLVTLGMVAGAAYLAWEPRDTELVQAEQEPLVDECGTRPAKAPAPTTTTAPTVSSTTTSSSTTLANTSTPPEPTSVAPTSTAPDGSSTTAASSTTSTVIADAHWSCSWVEDFDGAELDRDRWMAQTTTGANFGVGGECFVDDPDNIAVADGVLALTVRQEPESIPCPRGNNPGFATPITAGSILTKPAFDQAFGRYEIRARMPDVVVPGIQFSFWLWPRDLTAYPIQFGDGDADKWTNGELDVLESYSRYPYHDVPFIHYAHTYVQTSTGKWVPNDPNITKACLVGKMSDWHTYALEWTPTSIRMLFDGKVCIENTHWTPRNTTMPGPFDKPFMVSLTQALGAIGTDNQAGEYTPLPATTEVDYVKVWH